MHTCSRYKGLDQSAHRHPNCPKDYLPSSKYRYTRAVYLVNADVAMFKSLKFALKRSKASMRALEQNGIKRLYLSNSKKRRKIGHSYFQTYSMQFQDSIPILT